MEGINGMSHVGFASADLDRTAKFYGEVLGARIEWQTEQQIKLYVGDFGLAIPKGEPNPTYELHFAFKLDPDSADQAIAHVESCGVLVDGPIGHAAEPLNVSWFFSDPDGYRLEFEAHFPTVELVVALLERDRDRRRPELGLFVGGDALPKIKAQLEMAVAPVA